MALTWHFAGLALEADWVEAWGTWVGGLATAGALWFAIVALRRESERRREDIKKLRDAERDAQDAQARTVVLHDPGCDTRHVRVPSDGRGLVERIEVLIYHITLGNYGTYPITNVVGVLTHRESKLQIVYGNGGQMPLAVFEAGMHRTLQWELTGHSILSPENMPSPELPSLFDLEMTFTDVYGIRWALRPGSGQQPSRVYGP